MTEGKAESQNEAQASIKSETKETEAVYFEDEDDPSELEDVTEILQENDPELYKRTGDDDDIDEEMKKRPTNLEIDTGCSHENVNDDVGGCFLKLGNIRVLCPSLHRRTKVGVIGPNWFGPIFTLALLLGASQYYIRKSMTIGPISTIISLIFTIISTVSLFFVACTDPGVVRNGTNDHLPQSSYENIPTQEDDTDLTGWRYCDLCSVNQPPDAAHCSACNACIAGFDHHCVWMGICIGKNNYKAFVLFNLSWFLHLVYGGIWVSLFGKLTVPHNS